MKKKTSKNQPIDFTEKFERICGIGVCTLALIFFGFIALFSMKLTAVINPKKFVSENILFENDNILVNLMFIVLFALITAGLYRFRNYFKKVTDKQLMLGLFIYTLVLGLIWVLRVQCDPWADSLDVQNGAVLMIKNDATVFTKTDWSYIKDYNYFQMYPYQLGLVFISEIIYRIFGYETAMPLEVINVIALALLYLGLQKIVKKLFQNSGTLFILTFFLAACLQPIFMTAFPYGLIIGFSAAIWACYFIICFMQSKHKKRVLYFIPATILMMISILAKYNNMIWLIAIAIAMVIYIIRKKDWFTAIPLVIFCVISALSLNMVISHYERKTGVELGDGVSQIMYLDMGLNESGMAPGWYNGKAQGLYMRYNGDIEKAEKAAKEDLAVRKEKLLLDFGYSSDFFAKKILSQWSEPSYESIWASQVKNHYYGEVESYSWLNKVYYQLNEDGTPMLNQDGTQKYEGSWGKKLYSYFDIYNMIMYLLFCIAMISLIVRKCSAETMIMIIVLIGGFLYHMLFEGKSQYCVTYFILIVFFAAYGLDVASHKVKQKISAYQSKKRGGK